MLKTNSSSHLTRHGSGDIANSKRARPRSTTLEPLAEREFSDLALLLANSSIGNAMSVEELDGFFAGLLAGPPIAKPCQYWPVVLGKDVGDPCTLDYIRTTTVLLPLFARHWYTIAQTLDSGSVHLPYLAGDSLGSSTGRDWARGFMRAVELQAPGWQILIASDEHAAAVVPMMILAHEDDPNPLLQSAPMSVEAREELIKLMAVGLIRAHRYFAPSRSASTVPTTPNLN